MKKFLVLLLFCALAAVTYAGVSMVQPDGDGQNAKYRYGFWDGWTSYSFTSTEHVNWAGHYYSSGWGGLSDVYMQISLADISADAVIEQAALNIYITELSGSGSSILHRTDSSTANGQADQKLAGDVMVMDILPSEVSTGWLSIDVKEFIQSDIDNEHGWAVFSLPSKSYSSLKFASSLNSNTEIRPYISYSVVPEPATFLLFGLGTTLLARRRKIAT